MELLLISYPWIRIAFQRKIGTLNDIWVEEGVEENGKPLLQEKKQTDLLVFLKWGNSVENYELTQWNNNNNLTQTLSSLTDVSLHIFIYRLSQSTLYNH